MIEAAGTRVLVAQHQRAGVVVAKALSQHQSALELDDAVVPIIHLNLVVSEQSCTPVGVVLNAGSAETHQWTAAP
mgnify:FL=1